MSTADDFLRNMEDNQITGIYYRFTDGQVDFWFADDTHCYDNEALEEKTLALVPEFVPSTDPREAERQFSEAVGGKYSYVVHDEDGDLEFSESDLEIKEK